MFFVFGGQCEEMMTWDLFYLINSLVSKTVLRYLWCILDFKAVIARDLTFSKHCQPLAKVNSCQLDVHVRTHSA